VVSQPPPVQDPATVYYSGAPPNNVNSNKNDGMKILKRAARAHKHKRSIMSDPSEYSNSFAGNQPVEERDIDVLTQGSKGTATNLPEI
jgi:hypothetical protein